MVRDSDIVDGVFSTPIVGTTMPSGLRTMILIDSITSSRTDAVEKRTTTRFQDAVMFFRAVFLIFN